MGSSAAGGASVREALISPGVRAIAGGGGRTLFCQWRSKANRTRQTLGKALILKEAAASIWATRMEDGQSLYGSFQAIPFGLLTRPLPPPMPGASCLTLNDHLVSLSINLGLPIWKQQTTLRSWWNCPHTPRSPDSRRIFPLQLAKKVRKQRVPSTSEEVKDKVIVDGFWFVGLE